MLELVGRTFSVGTGEYRVVDVRQLSGELMVYAVELHDLEETDSLEKGSKPRRAAFHYGDIASRFNAGNKTA
ncbi:MAG: hypothetical protein ACC642_03715 [Pseudomonadales bacterium]